MVQKFLSVPYLDFSVDLKFEKYWDVPSPLEQPGPVLLPILLLLFEPLELRFVELNPDLYVLGHSQSMSAVALDLTRVFYLISNIFSKISKVFMEFPKHLIVPNL